MSITAPTEPIEVKFTDEITVFLQRDPTATEPWFTLMNMKIKVTERDDTNRKKLLETLAAFGVSDKDTKQVLELPNTVGTATLKWVAEKYIEEVTTFPTMPSSRSKQG